MGIGALTVYKPLCQTLTKAVEMSSRIMPVGFCLLNPSDTNLITRISWFAVERPSVKLNCSFGKA